MRSPARAPSSAPAPLALVAALGLLSACGGGSRPPAGDAPGPTPRPNPEAPVVEFLLDGEVPGASTSEPASVLWDREHRQAPPRLRPGKRVILVGRNFGPGPLAATVPPTGLSVPASPPGGELSKIMVGKVRALERDMPVHPGRIDLLGVAQAVLQGLDIYHEDFERDPDRWRGDLLSWTDTHIEFTIPITAYEGPIVVWRNPTTGAFVPHLPTGEPLLVRDPNTYRVRKFRGLTGSEIAYPETFPIARVGSDPLSSEPVPVAIATEAEARFLAGEGAPTGRSARDQFDFGEKIYWAHDWSLGLVHLALGINWDYVFGFEPRQKSRLGQRIKAVGRFVGEVEPTDPPVPRVDPAAAYPNPFLRDQDGKPLLQRPFRDRFRGGPVNPFLEFGAIPFTADTVLPQVVKEEVAFSGETPYPIPMTITLPPKKPLQEGKTSPTGWVGYVYAEARHPVPGKADRPDGSASPNGEWIGFNCAACHTRAVTYEADAGGTLLTKVFNGIPNPQWKLSFLALSGATRGLVEEEPLPPEFVAAGWPPSEEAADPEAHIDRSLLMENSPRGAAEKTMLPKAGSASYYANDYFFSPQAIPILTLHTPVRRALSHFEILAGFEGAYLHGEEPDGTRGPMSSRGLQDLTLYVSTMDQDDELLRRLGLYRWLAWKGRLADVDEAREGEFVAFGAPEGELVGARAPSFPPVRPSAGLGEMRDTGGGALAERFPLLAARVARGKRIFYADCERCHSDSNFGTWTNEDMHPLAGDGEAVGKYFAPTRWNRQVQSLRVAILENLAWVQSRGLLSDGHLHSTTPGDDEDFDALRTLVHPDRCDPNSELYRRLYTINDHTFRVPKAGRPFTISERGNRFRVPPGAPLVTAEQERFVRRHAYFSEREPPDDYLYWDFQKLRREYGVLEFGLDPEQDRERIGRMPAMPHPWCAASAAGDEEVEDLVAFLLTL